MFSITFTAISNLPQIRARICMFLWPPLKEGAGGPAWRETVLPPPLSLRGRDGAGPWRWCWWGG